MGDLVQYASSSAISIHKQVQRSAAATKRSGASGKKSVVDGYIVSTCVTNNGTLTKVVDTPAFLVTGQAAQIESAGVAKDAMAFTVGDRDLYTPMSALSPAPSTLSEAAAYTFHMTGCAAVGAVAGYQPPDMAKATQLGNMWVDDQFVYNSRIDVYEDATLYRDVGNIVLQGVGWATKTNKVSAPGAAPAPSRWSEQALVITEESVRTAAGDTGMTLAPVVAMGTSVAPVLRSVVKQGTAYVAAAAYDYAAGTKVSLFVAKVAIPPFNNALRVRPTTFAWASTQVVLPPTPVLTVPASSGLHVGDAVVTAGVFVRWDDVDFRATKAVLYAIDAATGAVSASAVIANSTSPGSTREHVWFISAIDSGLLFVRYIYDNATNTVYGHELRRAVGTVVVSSGLAAAGWVPWYKVLPGNPASLAALTVAYPCASACDLGGGRVGVIACPAGNRTSGEVITWHLIELDGSTLAFIADRGPIGSMVYQPLVTQRASITVITPQVVVSGVVTKPAVLLSTLAASASTSARITRLSTDGGASWRHIASGVGGDLVYIGNKLHPVSIGQAL